MFFQFGKSSSMLLAVLKLKREMLPPTGKNGKHKCTIFSQSEKVINLCIYGLDRCKALVRHDIFADNIAIKRHCNKKIIFFCPNIGVAFQTSMFLAQKIFSIHTKKFEEKCIFIAKSFYRIVCKNVVCDAGLSIIWFTYWTIQIGRRVGSFQVAMEERKTWHHTQVQGNTIRLKYTSEKK